MTFRESTADQALHNVVLFYFSWRLHHYLHPTEERLNHMWKTIQELMAD